MTRLLYLAYYLKSQNWTTFQRFLNYTAASHQIGRFRLLKDSIRSSLKYNISLIEYFLFHFYEKDKEEREKWAGTGYMYEYQKLMNPPASRTILSNKYEFLTHYNSFIRHQYATLKQIKKDATLAANLLASPSGLVVTKSLDGQCGKGVEVIETEYLSYQELIAHMQDSGNELAEEYLVQHDDLMALSPSGLNTIRIFTQLNHQDEPELLGCRIRISVDSHVDNLAAGNLVAPIDAETGKVNGPAVYSDITKPDETHHPITGHPIEGFQIPYWQEILNLVQQAAKHDTRNRSIGWDVAVTNHGPDLIEANHDWCKLVWQLPVKQGLKEVLEGYRNNYIES